MARAPTDIRSLARAYTEQAINVLGSIMCQEKAPTAARVAAATALMDRGWGKPTQPLAGDDESAPLRLITRIERVIVENPANRDSASVPTAAGTGEV